jgi:hypothetical protein
LVSNVLFVSALCIMELRSSDIHMKGVPVVLAVVGPGGPVRIQGK